MQNVPFGNTGMKVSRIGLGGYPFAGINHAQDWNPYTKEGKEEVYRTIHTALDGGINYIDTAPGYGEGHSETLIGEVMKTRRDDCYLATKTRWAGGKQEIFDSFYNSLRRLQTDYVDVLQLHGGFYTDEDFRHIMEDGPMDALLELKEKKRVRYIGFTVEDPWTAIPLVLTKHFDIVQVCYNLIRQTAGLHLLDLTRDEGIGVCAMRPMTSGMLQRQLEYLAPQWLKNGEAFRVCLSFCLSDSRVDMPLIGMRWSREVEENINFVNNFVPEYDIANTPRRTLLVYETDDARSGNDTSEILKLVDKNNALDGLIERIRKNEQSRKITR